MNRLRTAGDPQPLTAEELPGVLLAAAALEVAAIADPAVAAPIDVARCRELVAAAQARGFSPRPSDFEQITHELLVELIAAAAHSSHDTAAVA